MKKSQRHLILLSVIAALAVATLACGSLTALKDLLAKDTPQPISTETSAPEAVLASTNTTEPTNTPEPTNTTEPAAFIGGECDPDTQRIEVNQQYTEFIQGAPYPDGCRVYCLWVPAGSRLKLGIKDFTIDLDIYVDKDLSILEYSDHGQWSSNAYGTGDEEVTISNPEGRYYMQVCSYETASTVKSNFTIYSNLTE
jgi:hypothetical protein